MALNELLARAAGEAGEQAVFRVDHALGMATVQNLLALRRHDPVLAAVWDAEHIEQVEVRWEEDLALEGRAGYYDGAGALKDVMQNHMLQVLCLLAMEPPAGPGERELRDAKVAALRAARAPRPDAAAGCTRRARYGAGRIGDRAVPAYVDEEGVDPDRGTETFAEVVLELDTPRWRGTRFVLRAGKALRARRKEAVVRFRAASPTARPASLRIGIDGPRDVALRLTGVAPMTLTGPPPASDLPPYGHVLLDLLDGGSTLSVRGDEAEEAWRVVEPVLAAWRDGLRAARGVPRRLGRAAADRRLAGMAACPTSAAAAATGYVAGAAGHARGHGGVGDRRARRRQPRPVLRPDRRRRRAQRLAAESAGATRCGCCSASWSASSPESSRSRRWAVGTEAWRWPSSPPRRWRGRSAASAS